MNVIETAIPGVLIIEPKVFGDARGFFLETFQAKRYADIGIAQPFVQDNLSRSVRGHVARAAFPASQGAGKARDRAARRGARCGRRRARRQPDIR